MLQPLTGVRQNKESDKAVQACNDWLRLGAGRSVPRLIENYTDKSNFTSNYTPPSIVYSTLSNWSSRFDWPERATQYDATWEERKNAEKEAVFNYNVALDYERVKKLQRLAEFLEAQLYERGIEFERDEHGEIKRNGKNEPIEIPGQFHNVWLPDVKQIGSGEFVERVDIERFNGALISEYRAVLDDIAKETGGRVHKNEHAGEGGGEITFNVIYSHEKNRNDDNS